MLLRFPQVKLFTVAARKRRAAKGKRTKGYLKVTQKWACGHSAPAIYILQRGVQWKQGVVVYILL